MVIGACRVKLVLPENQSLKGKRQVIRSILSRVRGRFDVAIAEVGSQDLWQMAELGISCVSNETQHANEVLSQVVAFIERSHFQAEMADYEVEILHTF